MLLQITTTHSPATDLGYLLHKHPGKVQTFDLTSGKAHVFYPEATEEQCTAALLLDIDPVGLVRTTGRGSGDFSLQQYVNDRPYVASSFMSSALSKVYGTAMSATCKPKPELVHQPLPLEVRIDVIPVSGGLPMLESLFEPLGYQIEATQYPLDPHYPDWGSSRYYTLMLRGEVPLYLLLRQLYVLIPVLDNQKHYFIAGHEVEKLLEKGEGWLQTHPMRELITKRYLRYIGELSRTALERLEEAEGIKAEEEIAGHSELPLPEPVAEKQMGLHQMRLEMTLQKLKESGAKSILDLGCGEGRLLRLLWKESQFRRITGMDVSHRVLELAKQNLRFDQMPERQKERLQLLHSSLTYRDTRLKGYDAAAVVEVIEHLDPFRLKAFEQALFEVAKPKTVVLTTPNVEYNVKYGNMDSQMRHADHRFEWTREQFRDWAIPVAERHGYSVAFFGVGENDPELGTPSQMAVFQLI